MADPQTLELRDTHKALMAKLQSFMHEHIYPNEADYDRPCAALSSRWATPPIIEDLK